MSERLIDTAKKAVELNLRFTTAALGLGKDYVKALGGIIREGGEANSAPAPTPETPARQPIFLAGRRGETATGAFVLNNPTTRDLDVELALQSELPDGAVGLDPAKLKIERGRQAVIQIAVTIDAQMEVEKDYGGGILAPGLSIEAIPFVARRLPDPPVKKATAKKSTAKKSAAKKVSAKKPRARKPG